jgi:hypothetical protein
MVPDGPGVFLTAPEDRTAELLALYDKMKGEAGSATWPERNKIGEFEFVPLTVKVRNSSQVVDVARINYLDYAGESFANLFRRTDDAAATEILQAIRSAHGVLGVIDGLKLRRFIDGVRDDLPEEDFVFQIRAMMSSLMRLQRPVQLVLTKWDVLQVDYSLRQVLEHLMRIEPFRRFAEFHIENSIPCRLIPVSALGSDFVRVDGQSMVRLNGALLDPFQVEMPLACALTPLNHMVVRTHEAGNSPLRRLVVILAALPIRLTIAFPFVSIHLGGGETAAPARDAAGGSPVPVRPAIAWLYPRSHGKAASDYFARLTTRLDDAFPECRIDRYRQSPAPAVNA